MAAALLFLIFGLVFTADFFIHAPNSTVQSTSDLCASIGLSYHSILHDGSPYHRCVGNDTAFIDHHASLQGVKLLRPKTARMAYHPLVKTLTPDIDAMSDMQKIQYGWHIPMVETPSFSAHAFGVVRDGFRAAGSRVSVLGAGFSSPNADIPVFAASKNAVDGSDAVFGTFYESEHDTQVVSVLSGRGHCVDGLAPDAAITAIRVMNSSMMLSTPTFAMASYQAGVGDIQLRTFSPYSPMPVWDVDAMDDLVYSTIQTSTNRGALYVVSAGNRGQFSNLTSARVCMDSTMAGFHGMITVGAYSPLGSIPSYVSRGCMFMMAPGGDDFYTISMNNGEMCSASAGTSFSAPIVAAAAAQLQSICGNTLTGSDIQDVFVRTNSRDALHDTHNLGGYQFLRNAANVSYSDGGGFGRLHMRNAIEYVQKNKCPHVGDVVSCASTIVTANFPKAVVTDVVIPFPAECAIKRIKYVRISAFFSTSLDAVTEWSVHSPANAIPCVILPLQHPYGDADIIVHSGCWSFYNETVSPTQTSWKTHFKTMTANVDAAFSLEFFGFIQ